MTQAKDTIMLEQLLFNADDIVDTVREPLLVLSADLRVLPAGLKIVYVPLLVTGSAFRPLGEASEWYVDFWQ